MNVSSSTPHLHVEWRVDHDYLICTDNARPWYVGEVRTGLPGDNDGKLVAQHIVDLHNKAVRQARLAAAQKPPPKCTERHPEIGVQCDFAQGHAGPHRTGYGRGERWVTKCTPGPCVMHDNSDGNGHRWKECISCGAREPALKGDPTDARIA